MEKWIRRDYEPTVDQMFSCVKNLNTGIPDKNSHYESLERAKDALRILKDKDMDKKLSQQIEVVHEE